MLVTPVSSSRAPFSGPRPIDFSRDTRQVLDLLEQSFGRSRGGQGQHVLYERINVGYANPLSRRLNFASSRLIPGFVWEEDGKIIGNVTLISTEIPGRYLVANVAVHEEYRRQGIARMLMQESINHILNLGGKQMLLQVENDNFGGINLYYSFGFVIIGVINRWSTTHSRLRSLPVPPEQIPQIRPLGSRDWRAAIHLDRNCVDPDLNWPVPPVDDYYKVGFWRWLIDSLNGRRVDTWVSDIRSNVDQKKRLVGLVSISGEWGRPNWLRVRIIDDWKERFGQPLLNRGLVRLKQLRGGAININHPADDDQMSVLFEKANFRIQRTLAVMRLDLT